MVMFDLDACARVLTEVPVYIYEGTCELCSFGSRMLSDVGGVLCCDLCRNTIAKRIKEHGHPFSELEAKMDPDCLGPGTPGAKSTPVGETEEQRSARMRYLGNQLSRSLRAAYNKPLGNLR